MQLPDASHLCKTNFACRRITLSSKRASKINAATSASMRTPTLAAARTPNAFLFAAAAIFHAATTRRDTSKFAWTAAMRDALVRFDFAAIFVHLVPHLQILTKTRSLLKRSFATALERSTSKTAAMISTATKRATICSKKRTTISPRNRRAKSRRISAPAFKSKRFQKRALQKLPIQTIFRSNLIDL